jgi:HEAT repeat protein
VLFAAGHGYIHESLNAYQADVALAGEQLTYGSGAAVRVDAIGQLYDNYVKPRLFRQWVDPELDLLFVRSHGSPDIIHMDPPMPSEGDEADDDPDEPESPYDPEDVSAPEVRELPDGAEMVFLDCCFNGSFAHDEYVAEALLFDVGECVAVYANSRNVRQDIWSTENLGMIRAGYSAGEVHKRVRYLESHLLGDPTFAFAPASTSTELRRALETSSEDTLLSLAEHAQDSAARGVALERYAQLAGREALPVVTRALSDDPATFVRLKALAATVALAPSNLAELVTGRIDDPDPTVRKFAVILASDIGDPASADALIAASAADACMRVRWQAAQGLNRLGRAQSAISDDAIADVLECAGLDEQAEMYREAAIRTRDEGGLEKWCIERMGDDDPEKRRMGVRTLRGNRYQDALPILLELLQSDDDAVVRETAAEALGWWSLSHRKPEIRAALEAVLAQPDLPASVRDAALVSLRRLDDGLNVPLVP